MPNRVGRQHMRNIGLLLGLVVAACGTKNPTKPDAHAADATTAVDAPNALIDAPSALHDAPSTLIDAPGVLPDAQSGVCNVLTQTGCSTGEKCTWIEDQTTP